MKVTVWLCVCHVAFWGLYIRQACSSHNSTWLWLFVKSDIKTNSETVTLSTPHKWKCPRNQQLNARFYSCTCFRGGSCPSSTCGRKRCVVLNSDNGGLCGRIIEAARQLISLSLKAETLGCPIASPINIHLCQHTSLISFCHFFSLSVWVFTVKM